MRWKSGLMHHTHAPLQQKAEMLPRLLEQLDGDGDGQITLDEFLNAADGMPHEELDTIELESRSTSSFSSSTFVLPSLSADTHTHTLLLLSPSLSLTPQCLG
jgi:hypothetical protein